MMEWMKSLQLLLFLTPMACLLAQTTPASQPAAGQSAAPPAVQLGKPPAMPVHPPAPVAPPALPPDTVVLTVGEQKYTVADMDKLLETVPPQYQAQMRSPAGRRQFADRLTTIKVLADEGHKLKLEETPGYKTGAEQVLAQQYYQHLGANTKVDEATARKYYEEHKSEYLQVKARHILIRFKGSAVPLKKDAKELTEEEALAKAQDIRKKLADGADFATLAKAESDDAGSGANGGDLGAFGHGRMVPAFEEVAFTIPVGELSQPVKSQFGYHIIKVESREEKPFIEVRPEIERKLDAELVKKTMDDLKANAHVVMNPDYFGPTPPAGAPAPAAARPNVTITPRVKQ